MTSLANTHRIDKEFQVCDMAYLRLKEYRQKTIHSRDTKNLTNRLEFTISSMSHYFERLMGTQ